MRTNKGVTLLAALAGCFLFASARSAAAQTTVPLGSYKESCGNIQLAGTTLKAVCREKGMGSAMTEAEFKKYSPNTELANVFECEGGVWNENGKLKCNRNPNSAKLQQARGAIDEASLHVFGRKGAGGDHAFWLGQMFDSGMLGRFYAGMTTEAVADFYRKYLGRPAVGELRAALIDSAFKDVYNFGASPKDLAFWNPQVQGGSAGYNQIVAAERQKLNGDKVIRRLMITNAYKKTMGRVPTPGDYDYWMPRAETFRELVEAARSYLYSPNGAQDLAETVARALEAKTGSKPSTQQVNEGVIRYSQTRAIFDEM